MVLSYEESPALKIQQRGVQWKQGVVIYMMLYTSCYIILPQSTAPPPTAPPVMNTQYD